MNIHICVKDYMSKAVISINQNDTIHKAKNLFHKYNIHHLPVLESDKFIGIISSNDILAQKTSDLENILVKDVISNEIVSIKQNAKVKDAASIFHEK